MREIKFRAWHKKEKYMSQVNGFNLVNHADTRRTTYDVQLVTPFMKKDKWGKHPCYWEERKNVILMQFTGLKDKNGKEIYEGDIVSTNTYPFIDENKQNYVGVIEWVFAGFQYILRCVNPSKSGISDGINEPFEEGESFEIIGNIYENPELLKEIK